MNMVHSVAGGEFIFISPNRHSPSLKNTYLLFNLIITSASISYFELQLLSDTKNFLVAKTPFATISHNFPLLAFEGGIGNDTAGNALP